MASGISPRFGENILQLHGCDVGVVFHRRVEVRHIGLMVAIMVDLHRLGVDIRFKHIGRVGQRRQGKWTGRLRLNNARQHGSRCECGRTRKQRAAVNNHVSVLPCIWMNWNSALAMHARRLRVLRSLLSRAGSHVFDKNASWTDISRQS
jgi:hypothetical protein